MASDAGAPHQGGFSKGAGPRWLAGLAVWQALAKQGKARGCGTVAMARSVWPWLQPSKTKNPPQDAATSTLIKIAAGN